MLTNPLDFDTEDIMNLNINSEQKTVKLKMKYKMKDKEMERQNGRHFLCSCEREERTISVASPLRTGTTHRGLPIDFFFFFC